MKPASFLLPALLIVGALAGPLLLSPFDLVNLSGFAALALATLGLAFAWGTVGILSLGHTAFFGLGAYAYAIVAPNLGSTWLGLLAGMIVPTLFALALGYFLFFGRLTDIYLGVITLCVALILYAFFTSTADPYYQIGSVPLGGFNGISALPPLALPWDETEFLSVEAAFALCFILLAAAQVGLALLRASRFGCIMIAVRENELRSELLGFDIRLYKLAAFAISAALGGAGASLYASISGFVGPTAFDLGQASEFLLWVIAGGLGSYSGTVIASFGLQGLSGYLGSSQLLNTDIVFGVVIIGFVLLAPKGLVPTSMAAMQKLLSRRAKEVDQP
jgi:ABC-type branched-subunit amino acid transport system permease subunit